MKRLIRTKLEHLVKWILEQALKEHLSEEVKVTLYMDGLIETESKK